MVLMLEQISVALLVVVLLIRVPTALRNRTYQWLWLVCAAATASTFIYVSAVFNWIWLETWGLGTSIAIAVFSALAAKAPRHIVIAILVSYTALSCLTLYRGLVEFPPSMGCVDRLHAPWYDGFWWLLVLVHVSSTGYATIVFLNLLRVASKKDSMHVELGWFAAGMISSTLYWGGLQFVHIAHKVYLVTPLQYLGCIGVLCLSAGLSSDLFRSCAQRLAATRMYRKLEPLNWYISLALGESLMPSPGIAALLGSRTYPPQDRLYRLTTTICDGLLEVVDFSTGRRGGNYDAQITCIHRAMQAEGWQPGDPINTGFMMRVISRLHPVQRSRMGVQLPGGRTEANSSPTRLGHVSRIS
jgi:hypothetical protein